MFRFVSLRKIFIDSSSLSVVYEQMCKNLRVISTQMLFLVLAALLHLFRNISTVLRNFIWYGALLFICSTILSFVLLAYLIDDVVVRLISSSNMYNFCVF